MKIKTPLIISLKNLIKSGELYLNDTYSTSIARDFFINVQEIKKYIKKHYHNEDLLYYANQLPTYTIEKNTKLEQSKWEIFLRSSYRLGKFIEAFNISVSPKREKLRNEVSSQIIKITKATKLIIEKLLQE